MTGIVLIFPNYEASLVFDLADTLDKFIVFHIIQ
jgi:hypothetical protein